MKSKQAQFILLPSLLLLMTGITIATERVIEPDRGAELARSGALVIDVRSAQEIAETGVVDGALHIPHEDIDEIRAAVGPDKNRPVVVYCRTGRRSGLVQAALEAEGYTGVINGGGFRELDTALSAR